MFVPFPESKRLVLFRTAWWVLVLWIAAGELLPLNSVPVRTAIAAVHSHRNAHMLSYALLALWPWIYERRETALAFGALAVSIGVALEFAQRLTPDRHFHVQDMLANAAGVAIGILIAVAASAILAYSKRG